MTTSCGQVMTSLAIMGQAKNDSLYFHVDAEGKLTCDPDKSYPMNADDVAWAVRKAHDFVKLNEELLKQDNHFSGDQSYLKQVQQTRYIAEEALKGLKKVGTALSKAEEDALMQQIQAGIAILDGTAKKYLYGKPAEQRWSNCALDLADAVVQHVNANRDGVENEEDLSWINRTIQGVDRCFAAVSNGVSEQPRVPVPSPKEIEYSDSERDTAGSSNPGGESVDESSQQPTLPLPPPNDRDLTGDTVLPAAGSEAQSLESGQSERSA